MLSMCARVSNIYVAGTTEAHSSQDAPFLCTYTQSMRGAESMYLGGGSRHTSSGECIWCHCGLLLTVTSMLPKVDQQG